MYEKCKTYLETLKSYVTVKRLIIGALCVLVLYSIGSLASGYFTARANYKRASEQLERAQKELDRSKQLNQELKLIIERSSVLNSEARYRIERAEDYQRRAGQGIERAQEYQRETEQRVGESLSSNNRAGELLDRNIQLIERVEERAKEDQGH